MKLGVLFYRTMLLHTILWLQWLLCMTVAWKWLITLHVLLIWHHLNIFCFPTMKKHLAGVGEQKIVSNRSSIGPTMRSYLQLGEDFLELLYATLMEEECGLQGRLHVCWKTNHIWSNSTITSSSAYEHFIPPLYVRTELYCEAEWQFSSLCRSTKNIKDRCEIWAHFYCDTL